MKRVLCQAVVDPLPNGKFKVTVSGKEAHEGNQRTYELRKPNEDSAAQEGMRRFVEEMEADS